MLPPPRPTATPPQKGGESMPQELSSFRGGVPEGGGGGNIDSPFLSENTFVNHLSPRPFLTRVQFKQNLL